MDIEQIITRDEFDSIKRLTYEQVCDYIMKVVKLSVEESLRTLPSVINHITNQISYTKDLSDEFYKNNPDLNTNRHMVTQIIERLESDHPGQSYDKLLEKVIPLAKSKLKELSNIKTVSGSKELVDLDNSLGKL